MHAPGPAAVISGEAPACSAQPTVSILIVSHNTRDMTLACLRSIVRESQPGGFEIIVIDNASTDGSPDAIAAEFPDVRCVRSLENLGFACANNLAAEEASGRLILLLNPDTVILDHAIDRLLAFAASHPEAGIWGGRTVFADGSLNASSCWRFMTPWSVFAQAVGLSALFPASERLNPESYGRWTRDCVRDVDFITGCFLLIRRDLWDRLGGFDGRFFMYAEEADLCYRAHRIGARPLFTPDATIVHHGGASEATLASKISKVFAGKVTYIGKHWPRPVGRVCVRLLVLHVLTRTVGYSVRARLTGSCAHRKRAGEWRRVWETRYDWVSGYGVER